MNDERKKRDCDAIIALAILNMKNNAKLYVKYLKDKFGSETVSKETGIDLDDLTESSLKIILEKYDFLDTVLNDVDKKISEEGPSIALYDFYKPYAGDFTKFDLALMRKFINKQAEENGQRVVANADEIKQEAINRLRLLQRDESTIRNYEKNKITCHKTDGVETVVEKDTECFNIIEDLHKQNMYVYYVVGRGNGFDFLTVPINKSQWESDKDLMEDNIFFVNEYYFNYGEITERVKELDLTISKS